MNVSGTFAVDALNLMWAFRATHADVSLADIDRLPSTGLGVAALPDDWRDYFKEQINRVRADVQRPSTHPSPAWPGFRPFSLREKVRESENVTSFHLIPEDGRPLPPYLPGQYLTVRLAISGVERPVVRSYSLSDAARPDRYRLTIKRIGPRPGETRAKAGLVSSHFHDRLAVGDRIEAKAPAGAFTIDLKQHDRPLVLIGGGIGITPLLSMLNAIVAAHWRQAQHGDQRGPRLPRRSACCAGKAHARTLPARRTFSAGVREASPLPPLAYP